LLYQLRREAKQSVEVAVCIAKFDGNVSALDVAEVFKALAKGLTVLGVEA
jgi:tellurite resistance protein